MRLLLLLAVQFRPFGLHSHRMGSSSRIVVWDSNSSVTYTPRRLRSGDNGGTKRAHSSFALALGSSLGLAEVASHSQRDRVLLKLVPMRMEIILSPVYIKPGSSLSSFELLILMVEGFNVRHHIAHMPSHPTTNPPAS
ncbi:hypothetical protein F5B18DRAFT_362910 [Nemania serpens]|nr:hypothetical protein F5B18DRAFT_362910 [Nemania serpens]